MLVRNGRRHFIQSAGGVLLAIPFLRSLSDFPQARASVRTPLKRIIVIHQPHGWNQAHISPELSQKYHGVGNATFLTPDAANRLRHGALPADLLSMGKGFDVPELRGSVNAIRDQMCVFNGIMAPGDNVGGHIPDLQCQATFSGNMHFKQKTITLDQVFHELIYGRGSPVLRSMYLGYAGESFFIDKAGGSPRSIRSPREAYDSLVRSTALVRSKEPGKTSSPVPAAATATPAAAPMVPPRSDDEILEESFVNAFTSERRALQARSDLSSADKELLSQYFDNMRDMEARVTARNGVEPATGGTPPTASKPTSDVFIRCEDPSQLSDPITDVPKKNDVYNGQAMMEMYARVAKHAFMCDVTRVVVIGLGDEVSPTATRSFGGRSHYDVFHPLGDTHEKTRRDLHPVIAEHVGLAAKFAQVFNSVIMESGDRRLLDETLIVYGTELGATSPKHPWGHSHTDYCYVTFGGKDALNTGQYYDSLDGNRLPVGNSAWTINNFLQTIFSAFNLQRSDWEALNHNGAPGFGRYQSTTDTKPHQGHIKVAGADDAEKRAVLPLVLKG
jgi:hypothetical protein